MSQQGKLSGILEYIIEISNNWQFAQRMLSAKNMLHETESLQFSFLWHRSPFSKNSLIAPDYVIASQGIDTTARQSYSYSEV